jgi:hypothetical protein
LRERKTTYEALLSVAAAIYGVSAQYPLPLDRAARICAVHSGRASRHGSAMAGFMLWRISHSYPIQPSGVRPRAFGGGAVGWGERRCVSPLLQKVTDEISPKDYHESTLSIGMERKFVFVYPSTTIHRTP